MIKNLLIIFAFLCSSMVLAHHGEPHPVDPTSGSVIETQEGFDSLFSFDPSGEGVTVRNCDWDDCGDPDYRIECKAWVYIADYKCGFKYKDYADKYCYKVAEYWGYDRYDDWKDYCKVYPDTKNLVRTDHPPQKQWCAHYYAYYHELLGRGKSDVYKQFKNLTLNRVYNGHYMASMSIKFDKACKAF